MLAIRPLSFALFVSTLCLAMPARAQYLVADIAPGQEGVNRDSAPEHFVELGGASYFASIGVGSGELTVLWRSDGTTLGTLVVAEFPGEILELEMADGQIFTAVDTIDGDELWVTDGTTAGLRMLARFAGIDWLGAAAGSLSPGGSLWLSASTSAAGRELWRSDGTAAGTALFADINPGPASSTPTRPVGGRFAVWFTADDGVEGPEPFYVLGTGVAQVPVRPGPVGSVPRDLTAASGGVYFTADDGASGRELYEANPLGWVRLEIRPGPVGSDPSGLVAIGSTVYCSADDGVFGRELWSATGTRFGLVADIRRGAGGSNPGLALAAGGALWFAADDGAAGRELWRSAGTATSTAIAADLAPGAPSSDPYPLATAGNQLLFDATPGPGLWSVSTVATSTPAFLAPVVPGRVSYLARGGSKRRPAGALGGAVLFGGDPFGADEELWISDGTAGGTLQLRDLNPPQALGSHPGGAGGGAAEFDGRMFFVATEPVQGSELWVTDGTTSGTRLFADIWPGSPSAGPQQLTAGGDQLFFTANGPGVGRELYATDGTTTGRVADIYPGTGSGVFRLFRWSRQKVLFAGNDGQSGYEPWVSDGTASGTFRLADIHPTGSSMFGFSGFARLGGAAYFTADDGVTGGALWRTDATASGTVSVAVIPQGVDSSQPPVATADAVYFLGTPTVGSQALWVSDGTTAGTQKVREFPRGAGGTAPYLMTPVGGLLYFGADDGVTGIELWVTDGTVSGTAVVADLVLGSGGAFPLELTPVGGELFFTAATPAAGREPYRVDRLGQVALVADTVPGPASGAAIGRTAVSTAMAPSGTAARVVFTVRSTATGEELWASDGTAAGTRPLQEIVPGPRSAAPRGFHRLGRTLLFSATTPGAGLELWGVDVAVAGGLLAAPYGIASPGSHGSQALIGGVSDPVLGNTGFAVELRAAPSGTPAVMLLAPDSGEAPLGPGTCTLYVGTPLLTLPAVTGGSGRALLPMPVPNAPALIGGELFLQWLYFDPAGCIPPVSLSDGLHLLLNR